MRAEFEERQKSSPLSGAPGQNPLQNFDAAAWLSGASTKKTEVARKAEKPDGVTR
jgi:hypothetical protein